MVTRRSSSVISFVAVAGVACAGSPHDGPGDLPAAGQDLAVAATATDDYAVGALSVIGADDHTAADVATLHGDAIVRVRPDPDDPASVAVFALNRLLADTVRRYAPGDWSAPLWEVSVGEGTNPHDVAVCGGSLLVARYETSTLLRLDPSDGRTIGEVDVSAHADGDGRPEPTAMFVEGDTAYVVLQRLDRDDKWSTAPGGRLVAVDCGRWTVGESWELGPNPELARGDHPWFVSEDGLRRWADGGVVSVPVSGLPADARVVDLAVGADGALAFVARRESDHLAGCLVDDGAGGLDVLAGAWRAQFLADVTWVGDAAWFAARRGWDDDAEPGGVTVIDGSDCAVDVTHIPTTWAPYSLDVVPAAQIEDSAGTRRRAW